MKNSIIVRIVIGYVFGLIFLILIYFTNFLIQRIDNSLIKDYKQIEHYTDTFNSLIRKQTNYFVNFEAKYHDEVNDVIKELRTENDNIVNISLFNRSKKVRNDVKILQQNMKLLLNKHENLFKRITVFGLSNMLVDESLLRSSQLVEKKLIIDYYKTNITSRIDISKDNILTATDTTGIILYNLDDIKSNINNSINLMEFIKLINDNLLPIAGIIFCFIFVLYIIYKLNKQFKKIFYFLERVSCGDLTVSLEAYEKNEFFLLAVNLDKILRFKITLVKFQSVLKDIYKDYYSINEKLDEFQKSIIMQSVKLNETNLKFREFIESLDEMTKSTFTTKEVTMDTINETEITGQQVVDLINQIKNLSISINKIMNILKIINEITNQTELLSFNAAIEAARAGYSGKGFNVVAAEIMKLSDTGTESTKQISQLSREIINKIKNTIRKSESSVGLINKVEIQIREVYNKIENIHNSTEKETEYSNKIFDTVAEMKIITKKNTDNINVIFQNNKMFRVELKKLEDLLDNFRLS